MAGLDAFGTQLERSDMGGSPVFTAIANVTSFKGPGLKRNTVDVSTHDDADNFMQFIGTLVDPGEVSLDINYDPSSHDDLIADFADTDARNYKLVYPDAASTWAFGAFLTGFEAQAPVDGKLSATVTFKITGKPVLT